MKKMILLFSAWFLVIPFTASAGEVLMNGNQLLTNLNTCELILTDPSLADKLSKNKLTDIFYTMGYIQGMFEMMARTNQINPPAADFLQILRVVRKFCEDNPDRLHLPAYDFIEASLILAFTDN